MITVEIPTSLPYPNVLPVDEVPEISKHLCYVIRRYPFEGVSATVVRKKGNVCVQLADFAGTILKPSDKKFGQTMHRVMTEIMPRILMTMHLANIPKVQYYFANLTNPILVDVRVSINKLCSPGFIKDIFGVQGIPVQEPIGKPVILDEETLAVIKGAQGDYSEGKFILKSSTFKSIVRGDEVLPLYGVVGDETVDVT